MSAVVPLPHAAFGSRATPASSAALRLRTLLLLGCVAALAAAAGLGDPKPYLQTDAELALLLRGMAVIKATLCAAALAVLLWRFGLPIGRPMAAAYLVGAWCIAGASMLIWQLSFIAMAALLFHAGEIALLLVAWRDRGVVRRPA